MCLTKEVREITVEIQVFTVAAAWSATMGLNNFPSPLNISNQQQKKVTPDFSCHSYDVIRSVAK